MQSKQKKKEQMTGRLSKMYGNFVQVPYVWYGLCRKYKIPEEVIKLKNANNTVELNPMEINVLAYLANYDDCYPTNKQMAALFNVGTSTIEKYLKELRWVGFIKTYEEKEEPSYTNKRKIYVQFEIINSVLESENNPYECMVSECHPYECMDKPIQMYGDTHTDVWKDPYMLATNNKTLEIIKKNKKEVADAPQASDEATTETIDFGCKLKSLSNGSIQFALDKKIKELKEHMTYESIVDVLVKEFTGAFYQCDREAIIKYASSKLIV